MQGSLCHVLASDLRVVTALIVLYSIMRRDICIDLLSHKNDVWVVSCHWYTAISGELLSQAWIWGNKEVAQWHCHWHLASMPGLFHVTFLVPDTRFSIASEFAQGQGWDWYKAKDEGRIIQIAAPFSSLSFQQLGAKRYPFYFLIILVALWCFCFNIVNFSYWAQLSSRIEATSQAPPALVRTGIGGTKEHASLFCFGVFVFLLKNSK